MSWCVECVSGGCSHRERGAVHYITPAAVATVAGPPPYQADLRLASDVCDVSNVTYGAICEQQ